MLTEEQQLVGKLDEVTGEGPPVTRQNVESPITEKLNPKEEPPSAAESLKQHGVSKRKRVAQLIGGRCMVTCHLDGVKLQMLGQWGTG